MIRLSTTLDCWKNSWAGAIVVPTSATSSSSVEVAVPPRSVGTRPAATAAGWGRLTSASGISARSAAIITYIARSQRRKLPLAVYHEQEAAATGTEAYLLTPR